eukprot:25822-Hanusia_phi.AAC.1
MVEQEEEGGDAGRGGDDLSRWRVDVTISTTSLSRVMRPAVLILPLTPYSARPSPKYSPPVPLPALSILTSLAPSNATACKILMQWTLSDGSIETFEVFPSQLPPLPPLPLPFLTCSSRCLSRSCRTSDMTWQSACRG